MCLFSNLQLILRFVNFAIFTVSYFCKGHYVGIFHVRYKKTTIWQLYRKQMNLQEIFCTQTLPKDYVKVSTFLKENWGV